MHHGTLLVRLWVGERVYDWDILLRQEELSCLELQTLVYWKILALGWLRVWIHWWGALGWSHEQLSMVLSLLLNHEDQRVY